MQFLYGMIFVSFMTFGLLVSYIALLFWVLSMFPILRDGTAWLREYLLRKVNGIYFMCAASLVHFFRTPLYVHHISKDQIFNDEEILMICNHRTRVDIIFAGWCYASLFRSFPFLSVILKDDLKKIPLFGWCMQIIMYIFLSRNKAADLPHLKKMLQYAKSTGRNTNYFLFPEGTDLSETRKSESHAYSKAKGLKELNYVMYPKAAAFSTCLESLRAGTHTVVHDLTVAYRDYQQGERASEKAILLGHFPKEIHLFVRKFQISDIPESEAEAKEWLTNIFLQKETLLQQFYEEGVISSSPFDQVTSTHQISLAKRFYSFIQFLFLTFIIFFLAYKIHFVRYLYLLHILIGFCTPFFGGFDQLELFFAKTNLT